MAKVLDVNYLAEKLKQKIEAAITAGERLTLASIKPKTGDYSSRLYVLQQQKIAQEFYPGIEHRPIDMEASAEEVRQKIEELNKDDTITGIVLNKPFPKGWQDKEIFSAISPNKDVEGMNPYNLGRLFLGDPLFIPPTVLSVLELIKSTGLEIRGKKVTIVGFSNIIGKPLALLLADKFATVSIAHIATFEAGDLESYVKRADVLISAAGVPGLIKEDWIKPGAIVIDVGIGEKDGKTAGDVEATKAASARAAFISPVPGGVGKLTTMFLFNNLVAAAKIQKK